MNYVAPVKPETRNLFDAIPDVDCSPATNYCGSRYWLWEQNVATPALQAKGYTDIGFSMGGQDSFGPLSRVVTATNSLGAVEHFIYG